MTTTICIPYLAEGAVWNELKYALRSVDMYFDGPKNVIVFGDEPKGLSVPLYRHARVLSEPHTRIKDATAKLRAMIDSPDVSDNFIVINDDFLFLRPATYETVAKPMRMREISLTRPDNGTRSFMHLMWRTATALKHVGLPHMNYSTHAPRIYNKGVMTEVLDAFKPEKNHLLIQTLYFNYIYQDMDVVMSMPHADDIRVGFFLDKQSVARIKDEHRYLFYNNAGLTPILKTWIENRFPEPSSFEQ